MENIKYSSENLDAALSRLKEVLDANEAIAKDKKMNISTFIDNEAIERFIRDSLIQRFEFCADLFWKYLKKYMTFVIKKSPEINGPKPVIRSACKAKLLSEKDSEKLLAMIEDRNKTSHLYNEKEAIRISEQVPGYYDLMRKYKKQLNS